MAAGQTKIIDGRCPAATLDAVPCVSRHFRYAFIISGFGA